MFEKVIEIFFWIFDAKFLNLFVLTLALTISMIVVWIMYMHLSKKDVFNIPRPEKNDSRMKRFFMNAAYFLKYVVIFPAYSFIWFVVFSTILILMTNSANPESILFLGIVLIASIRVTAYLSERMSEDMAKLFPLTFFSSILINPGFLTLNFSAIRDFFSISALKESLVLVPYYLKYLLFIILIEWLLRSISLGIMAFNEYRESKKSSR